MTLIAKLKSLRVRSHASSAASSSSSLSSSSLQLQQQQQQQQQSQHNQQHTDSPIDRMKAEVVVVVGTEDGLLVTATKPKSHRKKLTAPKLARLDSKLDQPETKDITSPTSAPAVMPSSVAPAVSATPAPNQSTYLLSLPNELLICISMAAGFFPALNLMKSCVRFNRLLNDPSAWLTYSRGGSSDMIQTEVQICTKIHTFDHLIFGLWRGAGGPTTSTPTDVDGGSVGSSAEPNVYFEHVTFNEQFDYLGGVSLAMAPSGLVNSEFFDHRETLPCYKNALNAAVAAGALPPSAPHGGPPSGSKVDHSCSRCARYDDREVLKSLFVFDQVPHHPRWGREGFSWDFEYPDGRRRLRIAVKPFQGALGYTSVRDLPSVFVNCLTVNGRQLKGHEYDLFQRLVNGKEKLC